MRSILYPMGVAVLRVAVGRGCRHPVGRSVTPAPDGYLTDSFRDRYLTGRPRSPCCLRAGGSGGTVMSPGQRTDRTGRQLIPRREIPRRGLDGGMAKQLLDRPHVRTVIEQCGRERRPEPVRVQRDAGRL